MAKRGVRKRNVKNRRPEKARVVPPDGIASGGPPALGGSTSLGGSASMGGSAALGGSAASGDLPSTGGSGSSLGVGSRVSADAGVSAVRAQGGPGAAPDHLSGRITEYRWILGAPGSAVLGRQGGSADPARSRT